ncbi:tRNA (adenosine(37)-N6)-threonylcarbamoyltransferase complex dimerization subunit type 1 TsaB [Garicola koreensis]|uniref:tRNA (adenosine(37)-N6)-threonylcarbamoyltransferase complex dimerization subunit type 1 TsaB n=1 Tax=Garicola koreensis TaxID=1262554 RepID=UPI0031E60F59
MLLLSIDSSAGASVALTRDDAVLAEWHTEAGNSHAEVLAPAVQRIMAEADVSGAALDGVVVGVGPGPFTGLRVGLALAHSVATAWDKPLHGVCSLDSLALRAVEAEIDGDFLAVTDARRREVYWAHYTNDDGDSGLVKGPFVDQAAACPDLPAVGAGVGLYAQTLTAASAASSAWLPHASELALLAAGVLEGELTGVLCEPRPLYLRESDAKVPSQMGAGNRGAGNR